VPKHTKYALLFTRIAIFYFLLPWQLGRFIKADQIKGIATKYYKLGWLPDVAFTVFAVLMVVLIVLFLVGFKKRITYGIVLALHTIGTITTIPNLMVGTESLNILFLAAIPTIGAMWMLYLLRDEDTLLSLQGKLG
jgi:hypothetical protein